jgi:hypothetical protein
VSAGHVDSNVDSDDGTRVRIARLGTVGQLSIAEFDGHFWNEADEARLDATGLKALAALALIVARECEEAS